VTDCIDQAAAARREQLEKLANVPFDGRTWTRAGFVAEFGEPIRVREPELVELAPEHVEADACPACGGVTFCREVYYTAEAGTRVVFSWCRRCGLGQVSSWGAV
jgi:hypothetical protein